jgi:prophage regulatory protein
MSKSTVPLSVRVLSQPAVLAKVPVSRTTLWRMERDGLFPKRIRISTNRVGWLETEIDAWLEERRLSRGGNY